jgi:hypothetical protein
MSFSNCISSLVEEKSMNPTAALEAREKSLPLFEGMSCAAILLDKKSRDDPGNF